MLLLIIWIQGDAAQLQTHQLGDGIMKWLINSSLGTDTAYQPQMICQKA